MPSVIGPLVCGARQLSSQGFRSLPVLLGGAILILGLVQGNINLMFFFVGLCLLAPVSSLAINMLWELIFNNTPSFLTIPSGLWKVDAGSSKACSIFTIGGDIPVVVNMVPSCWLTMMSFFYVYLFSNAYALYKKQESSKAPKASVDARKSQAVTSMLLVVVIGVLSLLLRYSTSCETGLGIVVSILLGGFLGNWWYRFMRMCGLGRLDDLFGISNRILPMQSYESPDPTVCVPDKP
jgi:hypothetical protein